MTILHIEMINNIKEVSRRAKYLSVYIPHRLLTKPDNDSLPLTREFMVSETISMVCKIGSTISYFKMGNILSVAL